MILKDIFKRVLDSEYIELEEYTASYCTQREGDTLYLFFEKSNGKEDLAEQLRLSCKGVQRDAR